MGWALFGFGLFSVSGVGSFRFRVWVLAFTLTVRSLTYFLTFSVSFLGLRVSGFRLGVHHEFRVSNLVKSFGFRVWIWGFTLTVRSPPCFRAFSAARRRYSMIPNASSWFRIDRLG